MFLSVLVWWNMIVWLNRSIQQSWCHGMIFTYPPPPQALSPEGSAADDFLDTLLDGSNSSSAPASPLWSPCTTDSGINEDPPADATERLHPPSCTAFPAFDAHSFPQAPPLQNQPPPNEQNSDVTIDLGKTKKKVMWNAQQWAQ